MFLEVYNRLLFDGQIHDQPHKVLNRRILQLLALISKDLEYHRDHPK